MSRGRIFFAVVGAAVSAYGVWLVVQRPFADLLNAAQWLVVGVIAHDFVLSPVAVLLGVLVGKRLGWRGGGAVVAGLVVLATVTLMAVPVLGAFGRTPENASLLNRDYTANWLLFLVLVAAATAATALVVGFRHRQPGPEQE